jgi:hypothetical protein
MKRLAPVLLSAAMVFAVASHAFAKDLTSAGIEEAFVDAIATCGPSSSVAGVLGKSDDPAMQRELRDALILEAADDAAAVPGANKAHGDCLKKDLSGRGYTDDEMTVLPYCVKHDWPDAFTNLGSCVGNHARLEGAMRKK